MVRGLDLFHHIVDCAMEIDAHDIVGHVIPDLFFIHYLSLQCRSLELIAILKKGV